MLVLSFFFVFLVCITCFTRDFLLLIVAVDTGIVLATVLRRYVHVTSNNRYLKTNY